MSDTEKQFQACLQDVERSLKAESTEELLFAEARYADRLKAENEVLKLQLKMQPLPQADLTEEIEQLKKDRDVLIRDIKKAIDESDFTAPEKMLWALQEALAQVEGNKQ